MESKLTGAVAGGHDGGSKIAFKSKDHQINNLFKMAQ